MTPEDFGAVKLSLAKSKWEYRGEGNANIVISLPLEKQVLRFPKSCKNDELKVEDLWQRIHISVIFISSIMKELLGPAFVSTPSLVYLPQNEVAMLNQSLFPYRPENRKKKELLFCGATLSEDHSIFPKAMHSTSTPESFCIELKPKQGFFPSYLKHHRLCSFCQKQELKVKEGIALKRSSYCPLDLFSGDLIRMKHAINSLLESPQNNLKIFQQGNLVYGDGHPLCDLQKVLAVWLSPVPGTDLQERFVSLLLKALLKEFISPEEVCDNSTRTWKYDGLPPFEEEPSGSLDTQEEAQYLHLTSCNFDNQELPHGSILQRVLQAQSLDCWGTQCAYKMLLKDKNEYFKAIQDEDVQKSTAPNYNYINNILQKGCSSKLNPIELYLIAASVRDCSILISFQELISKPEGSASCFEPEVDDEPSKKTYGFKISAVDVDPKPMSCVISHMKKNSLIRKACAKVAAEYYH